MEILKGTDVVTLQAQLTTITDNDAVFIVVNDNIEVYYDGENLHQSCYPLDKKIEWSDISFYWYAQIDIDEKPTGIKFYDNPAVILMIDWFLNGGDGD